MIRYDNAPVYEWDAIQEGIDLPNLQRTFAGIVLVKIIIFRSIIMIVIIICMMIMFTGRYIWLHCQSPT